MKLLIVDDQQEVGAIVGRIAQQGGWDCVHMTESTGVARVITSQNIDALLLDYVIEGTPDAARNGLTVVAELRAKGLALPVLLFTGWPDLVDMKEVERLGILSVLAKPLSIVELRKALGDARRKCVNEPRA